MKILLIEDDQEKARAIRSFLNELYSNKLEFTLAASYQKGVDEAINGDYDIILLDMTLPTFDGDAKNAGASLKNGGELIIRELYDEGFNVRYIIITQYETFNNETLETICRRLELLSGIYYCGCVKYNTYSDDWKLNLKSLLTSCYLY